MNHCSGLWVTCLLVVLLPFCLALDNGLARVPPMGWNSWNKFGCNIGQDTVLQAADQMVELGLAHVGYEYVNIDDCWMSPNRTAEEGLYQADPIKFPKGMKVVGDYIHSKGLKYGIYTSAGTLTCQGLPGSLGREDVDAATFADWGVDYLKYDNCHHQRIPSVQRYPKMRDALAKTGRPIVYSLCQWGQEGSWRWAPLVGNAWRTTGDIGPYWNSIKNNFLESQQYAPYSRPGAWADPDMLEVGNGDGLTLEEQRTHFAMWTMIKAPLILGNDLGNVSEDVLEIITNTNLIGINQDPNSTQAFCYIGCNQTSEWIGDNVEMTPTPEGWSAYATTVTGGDVVMMVINWLDEQQDEGVVLAAQNVGVVPTETESVTVKDLWTNEDVGTYGFDDLSSFQVPPLPPHGNVVYRFSIVDPVE